MLEFSEGISSIFELNIVSIKSPQLIGIFCGLIVFLCTLLFVVYALYSSGSFSKLFKELGSVRDNNLNQPKLENTAPHRESIPPLYESLLKARRRIHLKPVVGTNIKTKNIKIRTFSPSRDVEELVSCSNGSSKYGHPDYNQLSIWGWLDYEHLIFKSNLPKDSIQVDTTLFQELYPPSTPDGEHVVIEELDYQKPIGLLSLIKNSPMNLSIEIANFWITPAFHGKRVAHIAMFLVLDSLFRQGGSLLLLFVNIPNSIRIILLPIFYFDADPFSSSSYNTELLDVIYLLGYRRVSIEMDEKNIVGRRFVERCGFALEGVLKKHRIVQERNRDSYVYAIFNSDWIEGGIPREIEGGEDEDLIDVEGICQRRLKQYLGLPLNHQKKKLQIAKQGLAWSIETPFKVPEVSSKEWTSNPKPPSPTPQIVKRNKQKNRKKKK